MQSSLPLEVMTIAVNTLIVDDSVDTRAWLKRKLMGLGCTVIGEAENAADGLRKFEALHPQLVTLDLVMPDIEGTTAIDLLRHISSEDLEAAVLVVSARPKAESHELMKLGAIGYLEKPFVDFEQVADLLRSYFPELKNPPSELKITSASPVKKHGLSARLTQRS